MSAARRRPVSTLVVTVLLVAAVVVVGYLLRSRGVGAPPPTGSRCPIRPARRV